MSSRDLEDRAVPGYQPPMSSRHGDDRAGSGYQPQRSVIFSLAASTSFLLYLHRYTWNLVRPELEKEYGFSNTQLEAMGSAFFFPYALGQIPCGIICDLFGPHLFLVAIILVWSLLLPLQGMTGNFTALLAVRGGFGLAQAGCYPALSQVTRAWFPLRRRTQVQGWVAAAFGRGGGAMASIIMGTFMMKYLGMSWLASLWTLAFVGVLFSFLFLFLFRNSPPAPLEDDLATDRPAVVASAGKPELPRVLPFRVALRNRSYLILLIQQFLNAGSDVVFTLIMGSYFLSLGASDSGTLGLLISLPLLGGALGGIFGGYANDWALQRFSSRRWCRAAVAGIGMGIGGLLVLLAVTSPDPLVVALGLLIARFFADWNQPTVWGTCTDLGGRYSATVFGITNMSGNMGAFLTPFAVGILLDWYSVTEIVAAKEVTTTNYVPAFVLCGGMMLVAAAAWLVIDCSQRIVPDIDED
jgi:MFS family permease